LEVPVAPFHRYSSCSLPLTVESGSPDPRFLGSRFLERKLNVIRAATRHDPPLLQTLQQAADLHKLDARYKGASLWCLKMLIRTQKSRKHFGPFAFFGQRWLRSRYSQGMFPPNCSVFFDRREQFFRRAIHPPRNEAAFLSGTMVTSVFDTHSFYDGPVVSPSDVSFHAFRFIPLFPPLYFVEF